MHPFPTCVVLHELNLSLNGALNVYFDCVNLKI